ncbi:MAG: O-antigen ligase family protein [Porticoccus sp.]|nr:O-antigen ligase family protein [Porticoccus sp.]
MNTASAYFNGGIIKSFLTNKMTKKISAIDILPYAWLFFLLGVCISPRFKDLNNIFYLTILPLTLFTAKEYFSHFIRAPIYLWLLTLAGWMALSSTWATEPNYSDLKSILYVIIFISGIALAKETQVIEKWGWLVPIAIGLQLIFSNIWEGGRLSGFGPMENPLYAGHFYVFYSWFFLHYKKFHPKSTISTAIRWIGFLLSIGACYLTQSRSAIVCLPLLVFIFLLQNNPIKYQKKIFFALLLVAVTVSTTLFFSNKWITLPSNSFHYQVNLDTGERLLVRFQKDNQSVITPEIKDTQGLTTLLKQGSNPKKFMFTSNKSDVYHLEIKTNKRTTRPWEIVSLYTQKPNEPLQPIDKFIPPRAFQFDLTFGYRTEIWRERLKHCLEKPIFGYGFSQRLAVPFHHGHLSDSHNFFLGTAFQGGIIALIMYLGLLFTCLYTLCNKKYWSLAALLICGIITTSFDDERFFTTTRPFWLLLLFPIGKALRASLPSLQKT